MTFTKEQLQHIIETDHVQCGDASALARMALAGMEAEPVGFIARHKETGKFGSYLHPKADWFKDDNYEVLKAYDAPQPLTTSERAELENYRNAQQVVPDVMDDAGGVCCEVSYADGWNACRAAMLQGKADGNSPAVPDGWVMVPVEPTEDMCNVSHIGVDVYTGLARDDEYYSIGGVCAAKVYRAMLAAAPQQE